MFKSWSMMSLLVGAKVRASDFRTTSHWFSYRLGRNQVT